jgi:hypothetical protein
MATTNKNVKAAAQANAKAKTAKNAEKAKPNAVTKSVTAEKESRKQMAIRNAFLANPDVDSQRVWVATRKNPKNIVGYVDTIDGDLVTIGVEGVGYHERKIDTLVLFSQPKIKAPKVKPIGDAREQNKGYAKLATKLKLGTTVKELNGEKREGHVVVEAKEGSGFVDVQFPGGDKPTIKHVADLRVTKKAPTPVFTKGDRVSHPAHGEGSVFSPMGTPDMFEIVFDKNSTEGNEGKEGEVDEVHQDELTRLMTAKDVAKAAKPVKLKFDDVNLFGAFISKDKTFVKVSKSNGIAVMIRGTVDEPFAMLATPNAKISSSSIQRFKKTDKVLPFSGSSVQ